jgi:hypothetical protein
MVPHEPREKRVQHWKTLAAAAGLALSLVLSAQAADEAASPGNGAPPAEAAAPPVKCLKAVVNPVTGHAICLEPKGAAVDPPPRSALQRPCPPRAHDADPFTV